ncbi:hypothetical protein vBBaMIFTN8_75 [Bordetella phage vB_BaM-IFTN8]|nr:hypothetical protein vBBaMIFTN4_71 [Bordetella phage vB_BaM-IFTN4]UOK17540.1 hypothetical protein vBBaMIFTN8_75 [Bordetella phage vB_BaM-IFTN8]
MLFGMTMVQFRHHSPQTKIFQSAKTGMRTRFGGFLFFYA